MQRRHQRAEKAPFSGQHLLHNKRIIRDMIAIAEVTGADTVLDIGAGKGAITMPLAEIAGKVVAIENDRQFADVLRAKSDCYPNVVIIQKDFLQTRMPREPFCVVANIPYAITTPILEKLLCPVANGFQKGVLMIEKGAAKRFTARPTADPRILAWKMWHELEFVAGVSRNHFATPPRVDSALVRIRRKASPAIRNADYYRFRALAEFGLQYPVRPMAEALRAVFTPPQIKHLARNLGVDRLTPIGTLQERQWADVFHTMIRYVEPHRWPASGK
ncbi:rRNA adenine methyltransferase [Gordoniibacillus kamchatkensis]|uniref:rRNA adenine N-6-methyltransferase n=1 Tax=Gordoniibacillus kamchatkensis TaxID=1590651 RepID=A0ABR5AHH4_9BACL|nr:23S ribosomal RNA methyltransferase Erm [Paenibacillus sp. VKM B-2647]KIL40472.1 rRNA adenine methyltransferase [Paenibacillus sp. VKM B-2647]